MFPTEKAGHLYERTREGDMYGPEKERVHTYEVAKDAADNTYDADAGARHLHGSSLVAARSENVATRAVEEAGYLAEKSKEGVEDAYTMTKDAASRVVDVTKDAARGAIDATKDAANLVADKTRDAAHTVADKTRDAAHAVAEKSKDAVEYTKDRATEGAENVGDMYQRAKEGTADAWERGRDAAKSERDATTRECPRVHGAEGHGTTTVEMVRDVAAGAVETVRNTVGGLVSMVTGRGDHPDVVDRTEARIERTKDDVKDAAHRAAVKTEGAYERAKDGAADAIHAAKDGASDAYERAKDGAKNAYHAAKDGASDAVHAAKDGIHAAKDGASDAYRTAKDKVGEARDEANAAIDAGKVHAAENRYLELHDASARGREDVHEGPGVVEKSRDVASQAYHAVADRVYDAGAAVANVLHKAGDAVGLTGHSQETIRAEEQQRTGGWDRLAADETRASDARLRAEAEQVTFGQPAPTSVHQGSGPTAQTYGASARPGRGGDATTVVADARHPTMG